MSPMRTKQEQAAYQNAWLKARREKWLAENGPCVRCLSWDDLQVDHIDATQKTTHRVWSWGAEKRHAELAKCQVLCAKCHLQKTWTEDYPRRHGTETMYRHGKCRCDLCKAARSGAERERRARKKAAAAAAVADVLELPAQPSREEREAG